MGQNLAEGAIGEPHAGQGRASGAPHVGQKVADSRTWEPHDEQDRMANYGPMLPRSSCLAGSPGRTGLISSGATFSVSDTRDQPIPEGPLRWSSRFRTWDLRQVGVKQRTSHRDWEEVSSLACPHCCCEKHCCDLRKLAGSSHVEPASDGINRSRARMSGVWARIREH